MLARLLARKYLVSALAALGIFAAAGLVWKSTKQDLRDEGRQECIQTVNEEALKTLQKALEGERQARAQQAVIAKEVIKENQLMRQRLIQMQEKLNWFEAEIRVQAETDEDYNEWASSDLPAGVADRLRRLASGGGDLRSGGEDGR